MADFGATNSSVYVAGARLSTLYVDFRALEGETFAIANQLAQYFRIEASRIASVSVFATVDARTAFTFIIKPSTSSSSASTSTFLASKFAKDVGIVRVSSSPFSPFTSLAPIIKSTVSCLMYRIATRWFYLRLLQVRVSVTSPVIQARANSTFQSSAGACRFYDHPYCIYFLNVACSCLRSGIHCV